MPKAVSPPFDLVDALLYSWDTNNRINLYLLDNLPDAAWDAKTPDGKGRNCAALLAHIHNVRLMWLKALGVSNMPEKLDPAAVTKKQAHTALEESAASLRAILQAALSGDGRIKGFKPDAASFLGYLIAHDAHHRGQASMLARQLGHPISKSANFGMWEWGAR